MFPRGSAGVGLIVLRSVVATSALVDINSGDTSDSALIIEVFVILVALCLVLGFLTPYCAAISCLVELIILAYVSPLGVSHFLLSALTAASVSVLGPGAYSMDSRIFGRKSITIPPRRRSQ